MRYATTFLDHGVLAWLVFPYPGSEVGEPQVVNCLSLWGSAMFGGDMVEESLGYVGSVLCRALSHLGVVAVELPTTVVGGRHGWAVSSVQVRDSPPPPPLRAHLVTKGRLRAIHRVASKAPENFVPFAGDPRECRVEVGLRRFLTQSISANPHGAPGPLTRDQRRIGQDGALYKCRLLPT